MHRLSSLDAQFLAAEIGNFGAQYCGVALYETDDRETISAVSMTKRLAERLHTCPPLRWQLVTVPLDLEHPVFTETAVDLSEHISEATLPEPADEAALADEVARIMATRLGHDKPLWRLRVLHGLPGRTAVVFTLHHSVVDGIAAGEIFAMFLDQADPGLVTADTEMSTDDPNRAVLALTGLASMPVRSVRAALSAPKTLGHLDQVPPLRSLPGVQRLSRAVNPAAARKALDAPRTRFNTKLGETRAVAFGSVSLADVKTVKNAFGITVNDVVVAMCGGALRRRLTATAELPDDPLVAYLPVSTRAPDATERFGNAISSIVAPLPTHHADPRERLSFAHEWMGRAKARMRQAPPSLLSDVNDPIPSPVFGMAARGLLGVVSSGLVKPPINLILSNVPGSPSPQSCFGAPLRAHYPMSVVFDGFALNITVVSYCDQLDVGIVGDGEALADSWDLLHDIEAELDELVATATGADHGGQPS
ncbi:wax ester/triacylglycerol synthase family O-acyltransferase [Mycolicibacterium obuense]|uniref:Diacylglycerol O-acyltransferase n=1 Tax=Mycolicibacterium obuense TaxID=1807 RepID=A0A4R5XD77_9MYCO|nr:wax ester/triacylglycerol synthase family O-acyltransferase [Mycolicibacterium obuense]TDL11720.1 wax ester/triacylglycerol synthase family O-acyltransferase [Mycolicibacterium obuense]